MLTPDVSFYQAADALALKLGVPLTPVTVNLFVAWSYCEKPHTSGGAWQWNNPLNTKWAGFGGTNTTVGCANGDCVKQYPTQAAGVAACIATLTEGRYPTLVQALRANNAAQFLGATGEISTWGTNPGCIAVDYAALPTPPARYLQAPAAEPPGCPTGYLAVNGVCVPANRVPPGTRLGPALVGVGAAGVLLLAVGLGTVAWVERRPLAREGARAREWIREP